MYNNISPKENKPTSLIEDEEFILPTNMQRRIPTKQTFSLQNKIKLNRFSYEVIHYCPGVFHMLRFDYCFFLAHTHTHDQCVYVLGVR